MTYANNRNQAPDENPMISVQHLYKSFGRHEVLKDITEDIRTGEKIVIIGPSGSGKSTFLRCLNLLEMPTAGTIIFDGQEITDPKANINEIRRHMGMVFQHFNLFPHKTIMENIILAPVKLKLMKVEEAKEEALRLLRLVNLEEKADSYPIQLSGGQKRRAAIAGILAMNPEILVLDEPTAGMDPGGRTEILQLLKKLQEERGITILLVSHSMEDVADYTDRIIVMEEGKILWDEKPSKIFSRIKELEKISLAAPQVSYVMAALHESGWDVDPSVTTIDQAADEIEAQVRKRQAAAGHAAAQVE